MLWLFCFPCWVLRLTAWLAQYFFWFSLARFPQHFHSLCCPSCNTSSIKFMLCLCVFCTQGTIDYNDNVDNIQPLPLPPSIPFQWSPVPCTTLQFKWIDWHCNNVAPECRYKTAERHCVCAAKFNPSAGAWTPSCIRHGYYSTSNWSLFNWSYEKMNWSRTATDLTWPPLLDGVQSAVMNCEPDYI